MGIWIDIVGYEGFYQINEEGTIKSLDHIRKNGKNGKYLQKGKILKWRINPSGYKVLRLSKNGKVRNEFVHVLVARTFLPNPNNLPQVNHKDENKLNCNVSNLEWCSNKYNQIYSFGKKVKRKDTNKIYNSLSSVEEDGFIWQLVRKCCIGKQKKHKGVEWEYVDTLSG